MWRLGFVLVPASATPSSSLFTLNQLPLACLNWSPRRLGRLESEYRFLIRLLLKCKTSLVSVRTRRASLCLLLSVIVPRSLFPEARLHTYWYCYYYYYWSSAILAHPAPLLAPALTLVE